jgi:hypothetical protein
VNGNILRILAVIFILLMAALVFSGGVSLPVSVQVTNPEASVNQATANQSTAIALFTAVVLGSIGVMSLGIAIVFWLLNRQVAAAQAEAPQPFPLLAGGAGLSGLLGSGDSAEAPQTPTGLPVNPLFLVIGAGAGMLVLTLIVLVLA